MLYEIVKIKKRKMNPDYPWPIVNKEIQVTLDEGGVKPRRGSPESAGLDLYASQDVYVGQNSTLVPTGVHMKIPKGYVGLIKSRSGMAYKKNIYSEAGVIDSDYRGEIKVLLYYKKCDTATTDNGRRSIYMDVVRPLVEKGERIAQLVIVPVCMYDCVVVSSLDETQRGYGGFGSTGN